jgi:hypothetical protein
MKGRLAQLLTEGTSPLPRWLIKFDGQPQKDEEMYERVFGKLITAIEDDDDAPSSHSNSPPSSTQHRTTKPQAGGSSKHSGTSSEAEAGDAPKTKSSKTNNANATSKKYSKSGTGSDYSSNPETGSEGKRMSARDRVSAREARSCRRQAKIDEDLPLLLEGGVGEKRKILPPANHSKKRQRPSESGEVVIVKLLTGTLYLYRGMHRRRAEFIRKV